MSELFRKPYRHEHRSYHFDVDDRSHVVVTAQDAEGHTTSFKMQKTETTDWKIAGDAGLPEWVFEAGPYLAAHLDGEL